MSVSILGAGISGLSVCHFIKKTRPHINTRIYEKTNIPGGWIASEKSRYNFELGPRSIRSGSLNHTIDIINDLNLENELIYPSNDAQGRFIGRNGKLVKVPSSILEFIKEPVISRSIPEILKFTLKNQSSINREDESIYNFYSRQIGPTLTDYLLSPVFVGINGSNIHQLSIKTLQKEVFEASQLNKRFIWTLLCLSIPDDEIHPLKSKIIEKGPMFSFKNGLDTLPLSLATAYKSSIKLETTVKSIHFNNDKPVLEFFNKDVKEESDVIISTLPAFEIARLLKPHDEEVSMLLSSIEYASMACVTVAFDNDLIPKDYRGFGFLVSPKDKNPLLGAIFDSVIFPEENKQTKITFMIGGHKNIHKNIIDITQVSDKLLENIALESLQEFLGIYEKPDYIKINICENAIPQHFIGHDRKMKRINDIMGKKFPMIKLSNAFVRDVSINGCIDLSFDIAEEINHILNKEL